MSILLSLFGVFFGVPFKTLALKALEALEPQTQTYYV